MSFHQKYFETINKTVPKIHDFILEFYNTKFYVVPLVVLLDGMKLIELNTNFILFHFLKK
jgi:hypothetical protein